VSRWVRDIPLTDEQELALRERTRNRIRHGQLLGNATVAARALALRTSWQAEGRRLARGGDALHAAGCMLYWAEGSKGRDRAQLTNSDPELLRLFVRFLRTYFGVRDEQFRVRCNLFADHVERQREIESFWLEVMRLPPTCLTKSTVNVYSKYSQRKRRNMLPYGTCRVTVSSTRIVQSIYGSIQEYGGFEREEWLW
jgi:hypothetical protein